MKQIDKPPAHHALTQELLHNRRLFRSLTIQRWASIAGIIVLGLLYLALSEDLTLGPNWVLLVIEVVLILPFAISLLTQRHMSIKTVRLLGFLLSAVVTAALIISIFLLIRTLLEGHSLRGTRLLLDAAVLWISNVIVFGLWFWEVDGGGPLKRHKSGQQASDFLFPQQADGNPNHWAPHFIDYLFVAFTNATAFSPTDTAPLTRQAKTLMMIEAITSLIIIALLAARAVNILS